MMEDDTEDDVRAISAVLAALRPLDSESRIHVLEFVFKRLGIPLSLAPEAPPPERTSTIHHTSVTPPPAVTHPPSDKLVHDIRTLAAEKRPRTVNEKVATIGYFLAHLAPTDERRDYLTSEDIRTYFIQAGFELPTAQPSMALTHAKNAGYLNALERGQYKLNAVGYNLVAHKLPSDDADGGKRKPPRKQKRKARSKVKK